MCNRIVFLTSLVLFATTALSGCTYLIPENPSVPRNNTVIGERHRPSLNQAVPSSASVASVPQPVVQMTPPAATAGTTTVIGTSPALAAQPAPTVALQAMPLPPVDPAVAAIAQEKIAADRRLPVENQAMAPVQSDARALMNVPPRPQMQGQSTPSVRLDETRRRLEADRAEMISAKQQLLRDATQDPSMLPVNVAPLTPPPPPPSLTSRPAAIAPLPASPVLMPPPVAQPPVPLPVALGKTFDPMAPLPAAAAPIKPISLNPPALPVPVTPAKVTARAVPPAPVSSLPPTSSSFNPLAGAPEATASAEVGGSSAGYLPPSRYIYKR